MTSSSIWQPHKTLRSILQKLCVLRALSLQDYVVRDTNSNVLDIDATLEKLGVDSVVLKKGIYHAGWLLKKNRKRYVVLKDDYLYWFVSAHEGIEADADLAKARGRLSLSLCSLSLHSERKWSIALIPIGGPEILILKANNDEEVTKWYDVLYRAITMTFKKAQST